MMSKLISCLMFQGFQKRRRSSFIVKYFYAKIILQNYDITRNLHMPASWNLVLNGYNLGYSSCVSLLRFSTKQRIFWNSRVQPDMWSIVNIRKRWIEAKKPGKQVKYFQKINFGWMSMKKIKKLNQKFSKLIKKH